MAVCACFVRRGIESQDQGERLSVYTSDRGFPVFLLEGHLEGFAAKVVVWA